MNRLAITIGTFALLASAAAQSQNYKHFPGGAADQSTIRAQERAESLYEKKEYKRALLIYEKDLAPAGDKYAQYMVGYMHLAGKGVERDNASALAWYRLAAERSEPAFIRARDSLFKTLGPDEIDVSNMTFFELWQRIGDNRLILDLVREDLDILSDRTGSRIPGANSGRLTIISGRRGTSGSDEYYEHIRSRVDSRLEYLDTHVDIIDIELEDELDEIRTLELQIRKEVAALESP